MKKYIPLIILLILLPAGAAAQDYVFFSDSPLGNYYSPSWGFYKSGSVVVLSSGKIPVDSETKYSGMNALRIRWKSVSGGDWGVSAAETNLPAHDITKKDSLTFRLFSYADIDSQNLPLVWLEDIQSRKTAKKSLSSFTGRLNKSSWVRVSIPLSLFIQSPDSSDITTIRSVSFGQSSPDGTLRTIYLDEIRMVSVNDTDNTAPSAPGGLTASGLTTSISLSWRPNKEADLAGYRLYRLDEDKYKIITSIRNEDTTYSDATGIPPKTFSYKLSAYDLKGNESPLSSEAVASTTSQSDSVLLDMTQRGTFRYFWDHAHPVSGLARDRFGSGDIVTSGGSGFGVMAIIVGVERGYISRSAAVSRMLNILDFLTNRAERFHGAYSHWLNGTTGKVIPFSQKDDGGDLVETAFLIQGLLAARQYFNQANQQEEQIRNMITSIWHAVEWDWYRREPNGNFLYWHWSPRYNWDMNFRLQGPNETMITYLLAIASPTHPVPASLYHTGWAGSPNFKNGKSYYGIPLEVGWDYGGPLFFAHYSFLGFDPRNKKDAYTNYFINNRNHSLIHQAYSKANPKGFPGYDADTWGLTASDDPITGYLAHEPNNDNGTISPTAALSSMPYTPKESIDALKSFYYEYGFNLWGEYGFKDAFNVRENWYANSYLAIDQGPIIVMIENYRTQLLWKNFMSNPEIKPMLDAIGFVPDSTLVGVREKNNMPEEFRLLGNYPNPFNPSTKIKFSLPYAGNVSLSIFDILGRNIKTLYDGHKEKGVHELSWDGKDEAGNMAGSGIYMYNIRALGKTLAGKMLLQK